MPITLTIPEGVMTSSEEKETFAALTDALLEVSDLSGNTFMTANIVGSIHTLPHGRVLAGGKPVNAAFVELKLPEVALATLEEKRAFIEKATDIVEKAAAGKIKREHIWSNILYAPEGAWGIAGRGYVNADLGAAIMNSAA
ncbi:Tautomerase enzyme [Stappia sp. BW2]|uniref:tautomerase family protein n=1 Tax=Stappia sp. BW2 TaxID=2592622 RepID=UPI0011DED310|nr:Tautomerase enzyme [Stappia sp. BW2]TYC64087.1 Tautomerase enzyme [Stappia sp. BW2]